MKKLTKKSQEAWEGGISNLQTAGEAIEAARDELEKALIETLRAHFPKLQEAIWDHATALDEIGTIRDDLTNEMREYSEARSEAWVDGVQGQKFASWLEAWESLELNETGEDVLEVIFQTVREQHGEYVYDNADGTLDLPYIEDLLNAILDVPTEVGE